MVPVFARLFGGEVRRCREPFAAPPSPPCTRSIGIIDLATFSRQSIPFTAFISKVLKMDDLSVKLRLFSGFYRAKVFNIKDLYVKYSVIRRYASVPSKSILWLEPLWFSLFARQPRKYPKNTFKRPTSILASSTAKSSDSLLRDVLMTDRG